MAAYAALVSLMNTMNQILNHPRISILFHTQEMRSLFETVGFLQDFIERSGTNCHRGMSKQIEDDLESQIAFSAHAAEDVIETHIADQILAGSTKRSLRLLFNLQKITEDMDSIKEKLVNMAEEERGSGDLHPTRSSAAVIPSKYLTIGKSIMVGFDDELMELMDVLTGQRSSRQIISIVGMGGTGKTTLARHVYESSLIVEHFDIRAWTTISQEYNVSDILVQLISLQGKFTNVHELGEQLYKSLSGRRYLIILDDMWSVEVWNSIKFFFPDNGNGSRVVLTTRLSNIATHLGSFCLRINFLDESKSWILFCQKVFGQGDCQAELLGIGKKIVEQCKGHALSIVVIGGLLRKSHRTEKYWRNIARNMNSFLNARENACLDVMYLSYSHLSPCLKPCFLHMGTFREDYEIRVSRVIKLWVAMGFIKPNGVQMLEEIAD